MAKSVNLASLPKEEALQCARAAGSSIFGDEGVISAVYTDMLKHWIDANMPCAVGQTDEEFGELLLEVEKEFEAGVDKAIQRARQPDLQITTNRGGRRVFSDLREVREFSVEVARDVAMLTAVLQDSTSDEGFVMQTMGLLNDISFQLQQAVELVCEAGVGHE
jgi:hypothetical protein